MKAMGSGRTAASAIAGALALLQASPTGAASAQQCTTRWDQMVRQMQTGPFTYRNFMASCLSGAAPATLPALDAPQGAPAGATARCRDGTYALFAPMAACERHRGVAALLR